MNRLGSLPLWVQRLGLALTIGSAWGLIFGFLDAATNDWRWNWEQLLAMIVVGVVIVFPGFYIRDRVLRFLARDGPPRANGEEG